MANLLCTKCGRPSDYDICDECMQQANIGTRQKHETRNPVDIMMVHANAANTAGKAYEARKAQAATEDDNRKLRSAIQSLDKIIADQNKEIDALERLVNEKDESITKLTIMAFLIGGLCILLCFLL